MDAVKFLEVSKRLCKSHESCRDCPFDHIEGCKLYSGPNAIVEIVEKWSKEHPPTTNGMKVLEMIPGEVLSKTDEGYYINICVKKSWWNAEYEEG